MGNRVATGAGAVLLVALAAGCFSTHSDDAEPAPPPNADDTPGGSAGSAPPSSEPLPPSSPTTPSVVPPMRGPLATPPLTPPATSPPPEACAAPGLPECPGDHPPWPTLLSASELGDAPLLAVDGDAVLVDRDYGGDSVVTISRNGPNVEIPMQDPGQAVDVADGRSFGVGIFVLSCDAFDPDAHECWLLAGVPDAFEHLVDVPPELEAVGVVVDPRGAAPVPCVFGAGLHCYDGEWYTELELQPAARLGDVTFEQTILDGEWGRAVATSPDGHYFTRERGGSVASRSRWTSNYFFEGELLGGIVAGDVIVLWGAERLWEIGDAATQGCSTDLGLQVVFPRYGASGHGPYVTADGLVVGHPADVEDTCVLQKLGDGEVVIDRSTSICGGSLNPRVLTPERLLGTTDCAQLP